MPIDGHSYLTKRGWAGKGSGLRAGSIARPIVASQKRDSKGLGKDRDDHFEFWDHVYAAAATTIKIKVFAEETGECEQPIGLEEEPRGPQRTSSGLVSTQQSSKLERVSSSVGYDAVISAGAGAESGRESLLTVAKREAARRMLYSKFYRGEVLGGEYEEAMVSINGVDKGAEGEGGKRKKKRKREEGEDEKHKKKAKKKRKKEKELEGGLV